MDANALRAMQAPYKDKYKSDPDAAVITLRAHGTLDESKIACKVETGRALAVAGLHPATGGTGAAATASCAAPCPEANIAPAANINCKKRRILPLD
jgi:hypothetical protein